MVKIDKNLSTREVIFRAAVKLFSQKGYHGTSIRDLAREAGIKESSVYNHFQGKETILQAILDFQMEAFKNAVEGLDKLKFSGTNSTTDPVEFWIAGTGEFLKYLDPLSDLISQILINEMFLNQKCREFYLNTIQKSQKELVMALFREMHEKGMINEDCDIEKTASQYVYMLQGLEIENKLRILEGESPGVIQKHLIEHISLYIQGLKNKPTT